MIPGTWGRSEYLSAESVSSNLELDLDTCRNDSLEAFLATVALIALDQGRQHIQLPLTDQSRARGAGMKGESGSGSAHDRGMETQSLPPAHLV